MILLSWFLSSDDAWWSTYIGLAIVYTDCCNFSKMCKHLPVIVLSSFWQYTTLHHIIIIRRSNIVARIKLLCFRNSERGVHKHNFGNKLLLAKNLMVKGDIPPKAWFYQNIPNTSISYALLQYLMCFECSWSLVA